MQLDVRFAAPLYQHLLWLVPGLLGLYLYAFVRKRRSLGQFIDPALAPRLLPGYSRPRQWGKALCLVGAVGCLVLALMQPQWGTRWQDVPSQGRDLMLLLDVSRSMLAEDVRPNRLERAKEAVRELVQTIQKEGGHRLGLVAFAGRARLHCPLTRDYAFFLQRLNEAGPDTVSPGGTAIGEAIRHALHHLATSAQGYADLMLLTDGEDHGSAPLDAAQVAATQQVSLYILGFGDPRLAAPIPLDHTASQRTYLQYQGEEVRSRLQPDLLMEMAQRTAGVYMTAGTRPRPLVQIYTAHIAPKARQNLSVAAGEYLVPRYHWGIVLALLLLVVEMLLPERQWPGNRRAVEPRGTPSPPRDGPQWRALAGSLLLLLCLPDPGYAKSPYSAVQHGNTLYDAGQYTAAAQQ